MHPSRQVALPRPRTAEATLERSGFEDVPPGYWKKGTYDSGDLGFVELRDVLCHSSAGIVIAGRYVVRESLKHTLAEKEGYEEDEQGRIVLRSRKIRYLPGTAYSILSGNSDNYYHWLMDGLAGLVPLRAKLEEDPGALLVPPLNMPFRRESLELALSGCAPGPRLIEVEPGETFVAERLMVPRSSGAWAVHPGVIGQFRDMAMKTGPRNGPRNIYIDRRPAVNRRMQNEDELIEQLRWLDIEPVVLEQLSMRQQANLFAGAELVVAGHGAGLTNLLFSSPGCQVVEVHMNSYVNWCFYSICAAAGLGYDCVIAPASGDQQDVDLHQRTWEAPIPAVLEAVEVALQAKAMTPSSDSE